MISTWSDVHPRDAVSVVCLAVGCAGVVALAGCDRDRARAVRRVNDALQQYDEGDTKGAIALLERAVEADESFAKPHYQLGQIQELDRSALDEAETHYRRAAALAPERASYQYALGRLLEKRGESSDAVEALERAVEAREVYSEAWFRLGVSQRSLGAYADAAESFETSIRQKPTMRLGEGDSGGAAFGQLGDLYARFGFDHKALKVFESGLEHNPDVAHLYRSKGTAQLELDRYEEAEASFERAVELDPEVATAYFNLSVARRQSGDSQGAIEALERYLEGAKRRRDGAKIAAARGMVQRLEEGTEDEDG